MRAKKIAFLGISVTLALVLSWVEYSIAFFIPVYGAYGIKIGLANVVSVFLLYKTGILEAAAVAVVRVFLVALLFGNVQSFLFGLAGAILSLLGMFLLKKLTKLHYVSVSVAGGVLHNIGQIAVAVLWTQTVGIALYLPVLLITGTASGALVGTLSGILLKKTERVRL